MPKIEPKQQRVKLGPFDVTDDPTVKRGPGRRPLEVLDPAGDDAYHVREAGGYRTVQRIDLATRLQLPHDYDPAELVGRTFLVEA